MPPKPKKTRQQVIDASVELIRLRGLSSLTARALGTQLNIAPSSIFTHFSSMEALREAALESIRDIYDGYARQGLAMTPPFKGFGMSFLRFAKEEPRLFSALFLENGAGSDLLRFLEQEGHLETVLSAICATFPVSRKDAEKVYRAMLIYVIGLSTLIVTGVCSFTEEELSEHLGSACRGFLLSVLAPEDAHTSLIPASEQIIDGSLRSYLGNTDRI